MDTKDQKHAQQKGKTYFDYPITQNKNRGPIVLAFTPTHLLPPWRLPPIGLFPSSPSIHQAQLPNNHSKIKPNITIFWLIRKSFDKLSEMEKVYSTFCPTTRTSDSEIKEKQNIRRHFGSNIRQSVGRAAIEADNQPTGRSQKAWLDDDVQEWAQREGIFFSDAFSHL